MMRLLSLCFLKDLSFFRKAMRNTLLGLNFSLFPTRTSSGNTISTPKCEVGTWISLLDLPDLVLESILQKLPPEGLCKMASVCTCLREMCSSDRLWKKHMQRKWGRVVGPSAHIAPRKGPVLFKDKGLFGYLINLRFNFSKRDHFTAAVDSVMSRYIALESGDSWFPAQVFNRENGSVGFVLSCYDAMVSYDGRTDTFQARYPAHGTRGNSIESGVTWDRLRSPPTETCPFDLHISDCLYDLQPGDPVEIQWRRNKDFPYGWWYGVVDHLETCDGNANNCLCHNSDTVVLEFRQYTHGSRWRRTIVNRKDHREEGEEATGFYGGVRKLCGDDDVSRWKKMWPARVLE